MKDHRAEPPDVAERVRTFYEQHPYPRPVDELEAYRRRWSDPGRQRADAALFRPHGSHRNDRRVLVAGCGTSQAAKYALRWPLTAVTGIDVSETSLEKTEGLKRKYHLDNLDLHRLPIERAAELNRRFDHVVCTGVLHHLPDPDAGVRALREVMDPAGAMHLMVYAPYGRAGVYLLQDYCRRLGIGSSAQEIRDLAASLSALPPDHPLVPLLRHAPDFEDEAGLADALLHPQDRAYSVPQLLDVLEAGGLAFGRWVRQAPYLPHCGALATSPHHGLLARLPPRDQYAAIELFRGTMVRHSVVAYRSDRPPRAGPGFEGDAWRQYVPIRVPDTMLVEKRVSPASVAVLINRSHTYTDLYLPITAHERRLVESIDGTRTIGEIAGHRGQEAAARHLFERLWWYDQAVFEVPQSWT